MTDPRTWSALPPGMAFEGTGPDKRAVPVVMPEVYAEPAFSPAQLMAMRICIGVERDRTFRECAIEAGCTVQNLSAMVKDYGRCLKAGFGMRDRRKKV
jgi:hypothetical protein